MALAVEDIMCDQCIISSEINITVEHSEESYIIVPATKLWLQNLIYTLKSQLVPALATFLANSIARSLAPLQRIPLSLPSGVVRIRLRKRTKPQLAITEGTRREDLTACMQENSNRMPEKCVNCVVLHEPETEPDADIIFVHGLHGGLDRTWAQGQWRMKNPKLKNLKPVRRRSTGNMYVLLEEDPTIQPGGLKRTLTKIYSRIPAKIARRHISNENNDTISEVSDNETKIKVKEEQERIAEIAKQDTDDFTRCWPQDWLPQDCPGVRVIGINYTTDKLWRPLWQKMKNRTDLIQRSKEMQDELLELGVGKRPIVWVGHSKGGLYIKQIILNASNADGENRDLGNILDQTRSIMFYSVPHKGSPIADMVFPFFRRSIEVLEVQTNCEFVLNLHRRFLEIFNEDNQNKPEIFSFIDTENTPVGFTSLKFIAYESADPDIGTKCDVPLDHREICKPAGRDCFLYLELVKLINRSIFNRDT